MLESLKVLPRLLASKDSLELTGSYQREPTGKDAITGVVTIDKITSVIEILRGCKDFKTEKTQMMYILNTLGVCLELTPKCHPEISGCGVEYGWSYSKLRFIMDFNAAIANNLKANVIKALDALVLIINRIRKFASKSRELKLTYALLFHYIRESDDARAGKDTIEHVINVFKAHRSAMYTVCTYT